MDEDRILNKLDKIEEQNTTVLVKLAKLEERSDQTSDYGKRIRILENWRWATTGSIALGFGSLITAFTKATGG